MAEPVPKPVKSYALFLLRRGLVSVTGAAYVCDCSKQLVSRWCKEEGIDVRAIEQEKLKGYRLKADDRRRGVRQG